jgi:hypothetical protein
MITLRAPNASIHYGCKRLIDGVWTYQSKINVVKEIGIPASGLIRKKLQWFADSSHWLNVFCVHICVMLKNWNEMYKYIILTKQIFPCRPFNCFLILCIGGEGRREESNRLREGRHEFPKSAPRDEKDWKRFYVCCSGIMYEVIHTLRAFLLGVVIFEIIKNTRYRLTCRPLHLYPHPPRLLACENSFRYCYNVPRG